MQTTIAQVKESGKRIELLDGSKWAISSFDAFHTQMWSPGDRVETGAASLTNITRSNKKVAATRL